MVFPARWRYNSVISRFPNGKSNQMSLSNKQKQFLKAKAHELKPIILLGGNGLTEGVMAEIDLASKLRDGPSRAESVIEPSLSCSSVS